MVEQSSGLRRQVASRMIVEAAIPAMAALLFVIGLWGLRNPLGLTAAECWWLMVAGLALVVCRLTLAGPWQGAGLAGASFLLGFGAQLALRDPFWFQHVAVLPTRFSYLMTASLALQGLVAAVILVRHGIAGHALRVVSGLGWLRSALALAILAVASKAAMDFIASGDLARYVRHLAMALVFLGLNLASLAAFLLALPGTSLAGPGRRVARAISLPGSGDAVRPLDRILPWAAAAAVFLISGAVALLSFQTVPHLDDLVYIFHARYFAEGYLTLPLPPDTEAFGFYLMDAHQGRWFTVNLPGWPAALAIGYLLGIPFLLNPPLAALSTLLLHRFVREFAGRGTANLAALLMAVSPWYLSMSATGLLHTFTWALVLGAWILLLAARARPPAVLLPLLAGALMGWLFLSRPLEGLYMGALTGLWVLGFLWHDRRHLVTVLLYGLGCAAIAGLMLPYNAALTGDPFLTPLNAYIDGFWGPGRNALGFGLDVGANPKWGNVDVFDGHGPGEALINAQQNLYELNSELFGWGGFSLIFVLVFALWGRWNRFALAMAAIVLTTFILYSLYWYVGGFYVGPRYWFMMLVPLVILSALGLGTAAERFTRLYPRGQSGQRLGCAMAGLGLCSLLVFESWLAVLKYPEINGYHTEYLRMAEDDRFRGGLIFVSLQEAQEYGSAYWLNDFAPGAETPLFARDLGPERNRRLAAAYPDRPVFFVAGRSKTRPHVALLRGPLTAEEL